jgi:hypothetical protein
MVFAVTKGNEKRVSIYFLKNILYFYFCPSLGVFQQVPCVAGGVPYVADEMINVINHVAISVNNGKTPGNVLHTGRIKGVVKTFGKTNLPFAGMVWCQQRQDDVRISAFGIQQGMGCHAVKGTIISDNEFRYAIMHDMVFDCMPECRKNIIRGLSVANKETAFHNFTPFELF